MREHARRKGIIDTPGNIFGTFSVKQVLHALPNLRTTKRLKGMRRRSSTALALLALLCTTLSACQLAGVGDDDGSNQGIVSISSGQSFGFCIGYCIHVLELVDDEQTLERRSWPNSPQGPQNFPDLLFEWPLADTTWTRIKEIVDYPGFILYDDVYGCPDCTDGGSEWVEIKHSDGAVKRVTFEFGNTVSGLDELIKNLRALRVEAIDRATDDS